MKIRKFNFSRSVFRIERLFVLLLLIVFIQCEDSDDEISRLREELSLEQVKNALWNAKDSVNLITVIKEQGNRVVISFESGDSLVVPSSFISETNGDSADWKLTIKFQDESTIVSPMIGNLDLTATNVTLNPFARCPLCALIKIEMPVKGRFKIIVKGKGDEGIPIEKEFSRYGEYHEIPILGLYPDFENTLEVIFLSKHGQLRTKETVTIKTDKIPENPTMTIIQNNYGETTAQLYFSSNKTVGFDQQGQIRWYYKHYDDFLYLFPKLQNGNLIVVGSVNRYSYHATHFFEISPLGQIIKEYSVPNFLHHEIIELPTGNFLSLSNSTPVVFNDGASEEDTIIEIDRVTGNIIRTWDFNDILDPERPPIPSSRPDDWLHTNGLSFDENDNSIIVSGRSQSVIVKIDYESGAIKWVLGNHASWKKDFQGFLLTAINSSGEPLNTASLDFWPSGQHSPRLKPNGNLLVYDNGDSREFYDENPPQQSYSRLAEYSIDEVNRTIQLVRQFNHNKTLYTKYTGSVNYESGQNTTLIGYMFTSDVLLNPKIIEVDEANTIMFEADFSPDMANYRALKLDLYQNFQY